MPDPSPRPRDPRSWTSADIEAEVRAIERARRRHPHSLIGDVVGFDGRPDPYDSIDPDCLEAFYRHRYGPGYERWLRGGDDGSWGPSSRFWRWLARRGGRPADGRFAGCGRAPREAPEGHICGRARVHR